MRRVLLLLLAMALLMAGCTVRHVVTPTPDPTMAPPVPTLKPTSEPTP